MPRSAMQTFHSTTLLFLFIHLISSIISSPVISENEPRNFTIGTNLYLPISSELSISNLTNFGFDSIKFHVPDTSTTLYIHLGFPIDPYVLQETLSNVQTYCEWQINTGHKGLLPPNEDPFTMDSGWGAAVQVSSAQPNLRLTWIRLMEILDGLWDYLILKRHFFDVEFKVVDEELKVIVGRGTVETAPKSDDPGHTAEVKA